ncbi:Branched-chain amino acid dehydrogenase [deaminating] [hydrothermal vent metagenome]|uniref:Branched-chain amino acid dehydrogenase [deaminating] n=1 Tax=hydrothermal vent metagenome TaxID=652676 RepID=A0A3B0VPQ0_9ZZZZ
MNLFETIEKTEHEQVIFCHNKDAGLRAIIAIHNTILGPALGGLRMYPYATEQQALTDVLRLSRGMTYKAAVSGLNLGGGKSIIIGDPKKDKSEALFRAFGRFLDSLGGRYITAEDVGIDVNDMEYVYQETENVVGVHQMHGGSGDPSPFTAFGTLQSIKASLEKKYGTQNIGDYSYAIQGVGHVGMELVKLIHNEGGKMFVTDVNQEAMDICKEQYGCEVVGLDEIYTVDADVYCPCALGATVNDDTIDKFKFAIVCGSANNQLAESRHGDELDKRGIIYAPDYAVNAGGLMNVSIELEGYNRERAMRMTRNIYYNISNIFKIAERDNIPTWRAADRMGEERIGMIGKIKQPYMNQRKVTFSGRIKNNNS